jgi:hypothetical protein
MPNAVSECNSRWRRPNQADDPDIDDKRPELTRNATNSDALQVTVEVFCDSGRQFRERHA